MNQDQFERLEELLNNAWDHADTGRTALHRTDEALGCYLDSAEPGSMLHHATTARFALIEALAVTETIIKELEAKNE